MAYLKKSVIVEAYQFAGNSSAPGWPVGWLKENHEFSSDQKKVIINKSNETIEGKIGDFVLNSKGKFFICPETKFNQNFELV